jgi:hypothetical protein
MIYNKFFHTPINKIISLIQKSNLNIALKLYLFTPIYTPNPCIIFPFPFHFYF